MNIFEKMSAITMEISTVAKNLEVGYGNNRYKAVSEGDVLAAVKPVESKHGIYSYPVKRAVIDSGVLENATVNGVKKSLWLRVETIYRFVNIEKPEEFIEITTYGDGVDSQDKATGKAMTYSDKYALLKAYKIMTGDDPDQYASEELKNVQKKSVRSAAPTAQKTEEEITERECKVLEALCRKKGYDPAMIFPGGIEKLTPEQYVIAVKKLGGNNESVRDDKGSHA